MVNGTVSLRIDVLRQQSSFWLQQMAYCPFGVTRNTPPGLASSSIHSAPSGATSTSRMRYFADLQKQAKEKALIASKANDRAAPHLITAQSPCHVRAHHQPTCKEV